MVPGFFPPQNLKELDQCLCEVIDAGCADPCRSYDHTGYDLENTVGKVKELLKVQFQFEMQFLVFQKIFHLGMILQPEPFPPDGSRKLDAQSNQTIRG